MKKRPINIHSSNKTNIIDLNNRKNYFSSKKSSSTTTTGTTSIRIPTTTATTTTRRLKRVGADFRLENFCIFRNDNAQNFGFKIKINQNQVQSKLDFFLSWFCLKNSSSKMVVRASVTHHREKGLCRYSWSPMLNLRPSNIVICEAFLFIQCV